MWIPWVLACACALSATSTSALPWTDSLKSNLAYRSPSTRVKSLAIDTDHVTKRLGKRWSDTYQGNLSFPYGVASGDPYSDSVILWTNPRKIDSTGASIPNAWPPICLQWIVSASENDFTKSSMVQNGYVTTTEDVRFSTKVEAMDLKPKTQYYYRFESCEGPDLGVSPVGSFKTLPEEDDDEIDKLRFAVFSCSNMPFGYFNAYGNAANNSERIDYAVHLGDYFYEYKQGDYGDGSEFSPSRAPNPSNRETSSLEDYRDRIAGYRLDPDLQELHRKVAWQTVWDDHEVADNTYKDGSADSNNTIQGQIGDYKFSERKANAVRAYYEWLPIRQVDSDDKLRIWRSFKLGKLGTLIMADTRQYDRSITDLYYNTDEIAQVAADEDRSMTGQKQQSWLLSELQATKDRGATWPLLFQQVVFSTINFGETPSEFEFNLDAWDGYRAERDRIMRYIRDNKIDNTVVLAGDTHASWVFDLALNGSDYNSQTGEGALGVEFGGSAVSSPSSYGRNLSDATYAARATNLTTNSPALQYAEGQLRGYFELEITPQNATAYYYGFYDQSTRNSNVTEMGSFTTVAGTNKLLRPLNGGKKTAFGAFKNEL
ncbi:hypothetical protein OIO90_002349 [Microbotryomycetes sp. JL221]|nr:hypothetical protein OIO90_002349 [Microbotryomycetes sp. JL221]